ncbi:PapB family radical SAM/SPASM ranthipeptide maturase [Oceanirhabdus sp. W0125-5]|uniref:PapB family radical SAM/SPASM ranthipeptide maturase n=1 Tax=Oceanirhabdus sp. W0125-5 TaxID=2999116 RepID=UPI0022F31796|nr:radical SAM protein [Oceanirhabdus sp. W0125-5]WBW97747.1 radical SAM protein [Oceanirhabdus sp. W0125-5]
MVNKKNLSFYPHKIIGEGGKKYLYNGITSSLYQMDDISDKILKNNTLGIENESKYKEALEFMVQNFIVKTKENETALEELYNKVADSRLVVNPTQVILMISQDCNLRCTYCYGGDGEYNNKGFMNYKVAKRAVDYLIKHSNSDKLGICFFGGEPLMNYALIKKIVAYAKEIECKTDKKFAFSMTTNGTLINKEIEEFIISNKIATTISIDGDEGVQNSNRYYANKKGCYDEVVKNTHNLRKTNLLSARATISPNNLNLLSSIEHLISLGFRKVAWAPAINMMTSRDVEKMIDSQKNVISKVEELINSGNIEEAKKYGPIMSLLKKVNADGIRIRACGTGINMIAVGIDGDIYPCQRFVGVKQIKLGNVFEDLPCSNSEFYSRIDIRKISKCSDCLSKNICLGGCPQEAYESDNNINIPSKALCDYNNETLIQILKVYINLDGEMKERLFG